MRIRRKPPKASRPVAPAYVVGYTGPPPSPDELTFWFNLQYGGPLVLRTAPGQVPGRESSCHAFHGPWTATLQIQLAAADCETWKDVLGWGHAQTGQVCPAPGAPGKALDLVLHTARLARGLTLLTDGSAFDVSTQAYLNPSDWTDRPLDQFLAGDHVTVEQSDAGDSGRERFATRGLVKFGLDEVEIFRPIGLPSPPAIERLMDAAAEIIRIGRSPAVGASLPLPVLGLTIKVVRHRTVPSVGGPVSYREITWPDSPPAGPR